MKSFFLSPCIVFVCCMLTLFVYVMNIYSTIIHIDFQRPLKCYSYERSKTNVAEHTMHTQRKNRSEMEQKSFYL